MEENQSDQQPIHPDEIRRPFKFNLEAGVAKRFIKACEVKDIYVRETIRDLMSEFADKILGKDSK